MKKYLIIMLVFLISLIMLGCSKKDDKELENCDIQIIVYDKDNDIIYNEEKNISTCYLIDVLNSFEDLELKTENGDYGEYILSINGVDQGDNYYWNYYINDEYAEVGVGNCIIEDESVYTFKLEKFE